MAASAKPIYKEFHQNLKILTPSQVFHGKKLIIIK